MTPTGRMENEPAGGSFSILPVGDNDGLRTVFGVVEILGEC